MYPVLHSILSDRKGDTVFTCFGIWHICFILLTFALVALLFVLLRRKSGQAREKTALILIDAAFGLYILDFFLMPFAYEMIDIEKLPFHICTAMCVACFLSRHIRFLEKWRAHFALLGFISNLVYLIYPAGLMWYSVHPLSYRVVQTLMFHGIMTAYGLLTIVFDKEEITFGKCYKDLIVLAGMTLWALIGNTLYNGAAGSYDHFFNWFFVVQDPFETLDISVSRFVMPFVNIAIFFAVEMAVCLIFFAVGRITSARKNKPELEG